MSMRTRFTVLIFFSSLVILAFQADTAFMAPLEEAMNPVIRIAGTNETEINCNVPRNADNQYTFEVDYTFARSTEIYQLQNIPFNPVLDFDNLANLGDPIDFNDADKFSETIDFFPFSFFDTTTSSLAIGENGIISLDPQQGGLLNLRYPSADIPNSTLTRNSIFASHYDLRIDEFPNAEVYYKIIGTFPARKMVITYVNAGVFYCTDDRTSSMQVVLEELTNKIQIFIKNKVAACGAITNAVVGIQDQYGNLGYAPNGRNYSDGNWTANNEAYEFIPDGARIPSISWIEGPYSPNDPNNIIIGNTEQITVNADLSNLQYTVEVRYPHYHNNLGQVVDLLLTDAISVSEFYPIALDEHVVICDNNVNLTEYNSYVSLNPSANFTITYFYDEALTNQVTNPTNFSFTGESIVLYAQVAFDNDCYDVSTLEISSILGLLEIDLNNMELYLCDNEHDGNSVGEENNYQLSNLNNLLFEETPNGRINYFSSPTSTTPINTMNITDGSQVWINIYVEDEAQCLTPTIGPITFRFYDVPQFLSMPTNLELLICDKNFNDREEFDEYYSWQDFLADNGLLTDDPNHNITVYETEQAAIQGLNPLTQVTMDPNDPTYNPDDNSREATLFVRIEDEDGCFSIKEIVTRIRFYGIDAKDTPIFNLCVSEDSEIPLDLSCFLSDADFNNNGNFNDGMFTKIYFEDGTTSTNIADVHKITYHESQADANNGVNPISQNQVLRAEELGLKNFFVRFTLCESCTTNNEDCFTVRRIRFRVISTKPITEVIDVCYENENESFVPNLNIFNFQLFNNPGSYTIEYYETQNDAENQTNQITEYSFTGDNYLWVRILSNQSFNGNSCFDNPVNPCLGIYRIRFLFGVRVEPIDFPEQQIQGVCDNNADGQEHFDVTSFETEIYDGDATFEYYLGFNETTFVLSNPIRNPRQVLFTSEDGGATASRDIYVKLTYADNACFEIVRLSITLNFLIPIETQVGFLCDCLPSPGEYATYNLNQAIDQMFLDINNQNGNPLSDMIVSFHNQYNDALEGTNEILNTQNYNSIRGVEEIYVRFYSTESTCYTVDTLTLKNLVLPVPIPGEIKVCDTNLNGNLDMILSDLDDVVMPGNTADYYFSYYWTYNDAENGNNPLINSRESDNILDYFYEFDTLPDRIFVRVDADNGECNENEINTELICVGINEVVLNVGTSINIGIHEFDLPEICDTFDETGEINNPTYNDGIAEGIDLTQMENEIYTLLGVNSTNAELLYYQTLQDLETDLYPYGGNVIANPTNYTNVNHQGEAIDKVYVKIQFENNEFCPVYIVLNINIVDGPGVFPDEEYLICPGGLVDIVLNIPDGENIGNYSFEWTLPDGNTITDQHELLNSDQIGMYSVRVTDLRSGCFSPVMNFMVNEINAPEIINLEVIDESSIHVIATGYEGIPLEYSLDGINYQSSNIFSNLEPGVYTVWVRYLYNNQTCISEPKHTILLKINNAITPNGDGYNDCINIHNLDAFGEETTTFIVYDRYGKELFMEKSNTSVSWCGTYGGRTLPTTNYWYKLILPDGREKSGTILLKNF